MARTEGIMVRGLEPRCVKKLKDLELGSVNRAVCRLLNELTKHDELIAELLAGDSTGSPLRRFVDLLPELAWGDHAFQQRKSLEVVDFYSAILSNRSSHGFPGILQVARHRCGFACLDVALDLERDVLTTGNRETFELADAYICLAIGFFLDYRENADPKNQAWQAGMAHYNLACAYSQRARLCVYAQCCSRLPASARTACVDHDALWGPGGAFRTWRDWAGQLDSNSLLLVESCGREAIRHLHRMSHGAAAHLASWIAEAVVDPDLVFVRSDNVFEPEYLLWLSYQKVEMEASGNRQIILETVAKRCPQPSAFFQQEMSRGGRERQ